MANKFKVGDHVVGNDLADKLYCYTVKGYEAEVVCLCGDKYMEVRGKDDEAVYTVKQDAFDLYGEKVWDPIIISRKGSAVVALNKVTGEQAEAHCNPEDPFDFYVGAQIAFRRLLTNRRVLPQDRLEELCRGSIHVGDNVRVIEGASFSEAINRVLKLCWAHPEWMLRYAYRVPFKVDGKTYKVLAMDDEVVYITKACCEDRGACWLLRKEAVVKEV